MVSQTLRFNSVVRALEEHIDEWDRFIISMPAAGTRRPEWRDDFLAGGGTILHTGVHMFDLLRYSLGMKSARVL